MFIFGFLEGFLHSINKAIFTVTANYNLLYNVIHFCHQNSVADLQIIGVFAAQMSSNESI